MPSARSTALSSMRALNSGTPSVPGLKLAAGASLPSQRGRGVTAMHREQTAFRVNRFKLRARRDLKVFAELSGTALPSKASARLAIMAHGSSGCEGCSRILQARSASLRSYKLQDNICSRDRFETAYGER